MIVIAAFFAAVPPAKANNIRLRGIPVVKNRDTVKMTVQIHFDVAWDNSFKTARPNNWDAAWLFVKVWDGGNWNHAYLMDDKGSYRAGSTNTADRVDDGSEYFVSNKTAERFDAPMVMEPAYSQGYLEWEAEEGTPKQKVCVGFFLHRKDLGTGDVIVPGVYVSWKYGDQLFTNQDELTVRVFAVEMVYIPMGGFSVGGTGTAQYQYGSFTVEGEVFGKPYKITSEKGFPAANDDNDSTIWALNGAMEEGRIPEAFPKGHAAFYIMKYELSQQGWCDFINCLTFDQQNERIDATLHHLNRGHHTLGRVLGSGDSTLKNGLRHYVKVSLDVFPYEFACDAYAGMGCDNHFDEIEDFGLEHPADDPYGFTELVVRNLDGQDLAMFWVSPRDLFAYAEWACLRPMTEFEYEKACRGGKRVQNDEYAWANSNIRFFGQSYMVSNYDNINGDSISTLTLSVKEFASGHECVDRYYNCGYTRNFGWDTTTIAGHTLISCLPAPLRVGCFADTSSTREMAGAGYWGVMNLSDNVAEMCISAYSSVGRAFEGVHGAGQLTDRTGEAVQGAWHIPSKAEEEADPVRCNQYIIERGMSFQYTRTTMPGNERKRWKADEFWPGSRDLDPESAGYAQDNWAMFAGMVSSRHRVVAGTDPRATQYLSTRSYIDPDNAGHQPYQPVMRGIRCVRTVVTDK